MTWRPAGSVNKMKLETAQIDGRLSADYELRVGDILTVRSNGNKQLIGRCILASEVPEKTSHSGFTIRIRTVPKDISPVYLVHFLEIEGISGRCSLKAAMVKT